jgi:hypothetical protein
MVSSMERMRVRTQHMARGVSEDGAGLQTLVSLRPARACGGGGGWCKLVGEARSGGEERRWWGLQTLTVRSTKVQALLTKHH